MMEWSKLLSSERLGNAKSYSMDEQGRSVFHKDSDRVIFSSPFRRLGRKTQVHPLASNDHIHTRLTHSIEVSSVGRSLGIGIGEKLKENKELPEHISPANLGEIVQAACLAHDIGNPPFGHAGEDAVRNWFNQPKTSHLLNGLEENQKRDLQKFEGNAQSFRIVSRLEIYPDNGGMRLTYASLAAMLKYPWTSRETTKEKFGCFNAEEDNLTKIAEHLRLIKKDKFKWCRHPLAFLTEAADDICYRILDLEDALEMSILPFERILSILDPLLVKNTKFTKIIKNPDISVRRKMSYLRAKSIYYAVEEVKKVFFDNLEEIMRGEFESALISVCSDKIKNPLNEAYSVAKKEIYTHRRKIELEIGSYTTIGILLETFCNAVREQISGKDPSFRSERILKIMGNSAPKKEDSLYISYMKVIDYISGMTDDYATYMAKQIGGMAL